MAVKNYVQATTAGAVDGTALTNNFSLLTTLVEPVFMLRIINTSDENVVISYDGVNIQDAVPQFSEAVLAFQTNNQPGSNTALMKKGTTIYVAAEGTVPSSGFVYVASYYQI